MALKATNLLRAEGDVGAWITPDEAGMHAVGVRVTGTFDGALIFETKLPTEADGDAVTVGVPVTAAVEFVAMVPYGWQFRVNADTLASGTPTVRMFPYNANFGNAGATIPGALTETVAALAETVAALAASEALVAAAITDVGAVITDLEGDVAGNSVAQAITDLEAVVTALGG